MYMVSLPPDMIFQSTLSVRRATKLYAIVKYSKNISIHALRKESDSIMSMWINGSAYFNPRSP